MVLDALDRVTLDLDPDEIATVAYILLDLDTCVARVARAGHLPPLLVTPDGQVTPVYAGGSPPLGAPSDRRAEAVVDVPVGSLLVLYSDGMVEDRRTGLDPGCRTSSAPWAAWRRGTPATRRPWRVPS